MDDPTPSPDALDELISAALDGEVTPAERARIDADPALRARLAEFERVRAAVRAVDPPDDDAREIAIAAALSVAAPAPVASSAPAIDLDARRRRRAERNRRVLAWAGAAAAVLVVGVVLSDLGGRNHGSDDSASTETVAASAKSADASITAIDAGADVATAGGAATTAAASDTTAAASMSVASPDVDSTDELIAYVQGRLAGQASAAAPSAAAATEAAPVVLGTAACTLPGGAPSEVAGPLSWQGVPGILLLAPDATTPTKAVILSADCTQVLSSVDLP